MILKNIGNTQPHKYEFEPPDQAAPSFWRWGHLFWRSDKEEAMEHEIQTRRETGKIEKAIYKIEKEIPSLKSVLEAFKEIFIGRTLFKINLSDIPNVPISLPDSFQFSQGVPLLSREMLSRFIVLLIARSPTSKKGSLKLNQS
jgi:hypothetical protein